MIMKQKEKFVFKCQLKVPVIFHIIFETSIDQAIRHFVKVKVIGETLFDIVGVFVTVCFKYIVPLCFCKEHSLY